ncbi:RecB-family nuclease [Desulfurococcus amylolyticus]|uniref:RecB-family nuclease n=1 Tax=Desulfurococcus amylolyticus DSM 16532 TaxID=768672 RepID=I3XTF7_DESAM|nr:RecB-family nuclease [Desulfurococcus amylolyticus]AFL67231.1 RecB-family nuclease [Desulfurococcus amylolyticus DSM 16532]
MYIALYSPSSIQKLVDFIKTVYAIKGLVPVVIKPIGAAAQIGVPEAHKIAIKQGKPFIVLPEISDLSNVLGCSKILYINESGREVSLAEVLDLEERVAILVSSGEQEPSRKEVENTDSVWLREVPRGLPVTALIGILVYELHRKNKMHQPELLPP